MNLISGLLAMGTIAALIQATELEDNALLLLKTSLNCNVGEIKEGIQIFAGSTVYWFTVFTGTQKFNSLQWRDFQMCNTFVAMTDSTTDGSVIFGKNSDRPAGEIQLVETFPAQTYPDKQLLLCTYIEIPQARHTYSVILSKPQWIWGAEMGANERGVVIGNEAVWTNQSYESTGLLGMDLLRLGLERGESALAATRIIIELLTRYGQGDNCAENR
jgi:hypothetical protein